MDRLYLPQKYGNRGLLQVKQTVGEEKHALADYIKESQEQVLVEVKNRNLLKAKQTKQAYKNNTIKIRTESWNNKPLYGKYMEKLKNKIDNEKMWVWLISETELLILAAQEQTIEQMQ